MTAGLGLVPLLAAKSATTHLVVWSTLIVSFGLVAFCSVGHLRAMLRYRRMTMRAEAELNRIEEQLDACERNAHADIAQMRADVDAYGVWADANDRFFHHGLVAVSHMIGARALPQRRACAAQRRSTKQRRAAPTAWRPIPTRRVSPKPPATPAIRAPRRACP